MFNNNNNYYYYYYYRFTSKYRSTCLQCFNAVGWVTERASGP